MRFFLVGVDHEEELRYQRTRHKKKLKKKSKEPSAENATVDGAHVSLFSLIKNVCITFNKKFAFTCVRCVIFFFTFHQNKAALL